MAEIAAEPEPRGSWIQTEPVALTPRSFQQLLDNLIPAIVIPRFASPEECAALVARSHALGFERYQGVSPPIDRIGVTVFEHDRIGMAAYFRAAEAARALQREIFAGSFDPLARFLTALAASHAGPVRVADDPRYGRYFAGLIRRIEHGTLLHIDDAAVEHPGWSVARARAQLSWNLYLQLDGEATGALTVHDRAWRPGLERFKDGASYGYRREVVASARAFTYRPAVGDVCLFNTRNFHQVGPSTGARVAFTSAIGAIADAIELWS